VKVVKPTLTSTVSGSEDLLTNYFLLDRTWECLLWCVHRLEKPLTAADKASKKVIASDACDVNRRVSTANIIEWLHAPSRMVKDTIYQEYAGECVML